MAGTSTKSPRRTRQRDAIARALGDMRSHGFVSAQELHAALTARGEAVGLSTVYRGLHDLVRNEVADTAVVDGETLFLACHGVPGHHHLVCRGCGLTADVPASVDTWLARIADEQGFADVDVRILAFGLCPICSR